MVTKLDLVMWTKNGAETLPYVLKRIGQVVPSKNVGNRIIVDDGSIDQTCQIAEQFGWQVVPNKGSGISDGANTALELVSTEWFASFEQDILVSIDWWPKIPLYLRHPKIVVASGLRFPGHPAELRKLEEYIAERYQRRAREARGLDAENYGKTLDNTAYKTNSIRQLGGFPKPPIPAGVDTILNHKINSNKMTWMVDYTVRSVHLRKGLRDELKHYYLYATCLDVLTRIQTGKPLSLRNSYRRLLLSPFRGFDIAIEKKTPQIAYIYPLMRLAHLRGIVASRKHGSNLT
jgi:glycosyltransferase involved in cell wall biosynthesis